MKTIKDVITIILFIIAVIALIIVIDIKCNPEQNPKIIKTTYNKHISKKNLIPADTIKLPPEFITQIEYLDTLHIYIYDTIYTVSGVVIDYFTTYNYKDTIEVDTVGMVFLNDSVTQNKIYYRGVDYSINSYTKILPEKYLFRGSYGAFYTKHDTINVLGANLSIRFKKVTVTGGYGKDINRLFEKNNNIIQISLQKNFDIKKK